MKLPSRRQVGILVDAIALLGALGLALGILAGFFGDHVRLFDTAAQFRAHAAFALVLLSLALFASRLWAAGFAGLFTAALGLYTALPFLMAHPGADASSRPRYTLLQMNLQFDPPDKTLALSLIGRLSPDIVTVQEMTPQWRGALERLKARYPYQFYCMGPRWISDAAILSRRPFAENDAGICNDAGNFAARGIDFNGQVITIASQHLRWPWPGRQWTQIELLRRDLARLQDPVLIAGDFNSAPWTASMRSFARASGTKIVSGVGPSWLSEALPSVLKRYIGLPIDNVFISEAIEILSIETTEPTSSDHLPVLVGFTLKRPPPTEPAVLNASLPDR